MYRIVFLLVFFLLHFLSQAQYTPILTEDFNDNSRNWFVGKQKEAVAEIKSGRYMLSSSFGKDAFRILAPVSLNSEKSIQLEANIDQCCNGCGQGGDLSGGILFAAKDEKNGYGFIRSFTQSFKLVKFTKGKPEMITIFKGAPKADKFDMELRLESWQWLFFVNGDLVYMCDPMPWIGDKAGLFVEQGTFTYFDKLVVSEGEKKGCPYTPEFTDEELKNVLESVYCDAKNNFDKFITGPYVDENNIRFWNNPDGMILKGQSSSYVYAGQGSATEGKTVQFRLPCPAPGDRKAAMIQYEVIKRKLDKINSSSSCGPSRNRELEADELSDAKPREIYWSKVFRTDRLPKVGWLGCSLYILKNSNQYGLVIFIYMARE